jgi:uncharacterized membrane protein
MHTLDHDYHAHCHALIIVCRRAATSHSCCATSVNQAGSPSGELHLQSRTPRTVHRWTTGLSSFIRFIVLLLCRMALEKDIIVDTTWLYRIYRLMLIHLPFQGCFRRMIHHFPFQATVWTVFDANTRQINAKERSTDARRGKTTVLRHIH